jgi:hypothetical protein
MQVLGLAAVVAAVTALAAVHAAAAPPPALTLSCDGPFSKDMSEAELKATFGAANVSHARIDGPEGDTYPATILFAKDARRTVRIVWIDDKARRGVSDVTVTGAAWTGPKDIRVGSPLGEVQKANGKAFTVYGFGWDYGGIVSDWRNGALKPKVAGCAVHARFEPGAVEETHALGDGTFSSSDPKMRADKPVLAEFGVGFGEEAR